MTKNEALKQLAVMECKVDHLETNLDEISDVMCSCEAHLEEVGGELEASDERVTRELFKPAFMVEDG